MIVTKYGIAAYQRKRIVKFLLTRANGERPQMIVRPEKNNDPRFIGNIAKADIKVGIYRNQLQSEINRE